MTETLDATPATVPAKPVFTELDPNASTRLCDSHASGAVNAVVSILLPSGGLLEMCGNCARKNFGYEHVNFTKQENRQQGSEN